MSPGQSHRVEVEGALEGQTVADAVRFVSSGVSAPGISYVHADHLGSPQKMTDSTKTIVWDVVYTPFGQVHSMTGTATNYQRFPGQYADSETGYNYNYFRDYDPTTGRYVQSDPIGLRGGLNKYAYVGGNPLRHIDPFGLTQEQINDMLDLARDTQPDLDVPDEVDVSSFMFERTGITNPITLNITIDDFYLKDLKCYELEELLELIIHESIHRSRPRKEMFLNPFTHPDINKDARRRANSKEAVEELQKRCECQITN